MLHPKISIEKWIIEDTMKINNKNGKWKMKNGKWKMKNEKWKVENRKWKMLKQNRSEIWKSNLANNWELKYLERHESCLSSKTWDFEKDKITDWVHKVS
jgi:hypothetical protein